MTLTTERTVKHRGRERPRNVAEGYGEVSIKTHAAAIAKMPRYKIS
jgi:hypothetical protein